MITVSTSSPGEAREMARLLRAAPPWLDWRVYEMGALVASSAEQVTVVEQEKAEEA